MEERIAAAGGVPKALVDAFTLLLQDTEIDPALAAAAISLPAASEVVDMIHEADPVLLHAVRWACLLPCELSVLLDASLAATVAADSDLMSHQP